MNTEAEVIKVLGELGKGFIEKRTFDLHLKK